MLGEKFHFDFMCISSVMYPLLIDNNSTSKNPRFIDFKYQIDIDNFGDYVTYTRAINDFNYFKIISPSFERYLSKIGKNNYSIDKFISIPCGHCTECLNDRALSWVFRLLLEMSCHKYSYFLTFTYDDDFLPDDNNADLKEISCFNKKLKTYLNRKGKSSNFRFYCVSEYGDKGLRPHYHGIYFGLEIDDLKFYKKTPNGDILYTSEFISNIWNKGFVTIGSVTPRSIAYVSRYVDKKQLLTKTEKDFKIKLGIKPESMICSNRPGIGFLKKDYVFNKLKNNCSFKFQGKSYKIPRFFIDKFKETLTEYELAEFNSIRNLKSSFIRFKNGKIPFNLRFTEDLIKRRNKGKRTLM